MAAKALQCSDQPERGFRVGSALLRVGFASAMALALAGCGEAEQAPPKPLASVRVEAAKTSPFASEVSLTGQIAARVQSELAFRIEGRIASRTVDVGDHVDKGQVLATLETTQQLADVSAAKAGVASAEATLKEAEATFARQSTLMGQGFTTRPNFDNAKQALDGARAGLEGAKAGLGTAEDSLANTELRADASGVVTARNAEVGQVVSVAQAVYTVAQDGPRDAVFEVFEALPANPPPDKNVEITLLSNPAVKTVGVVREIAPTVDTSRGTVRVKIGIENAPAGMGLGAAVSGAGKFQALDTVTLPWTAFFADGGKPAVWVVDPQSKAASLRSVTVHSYRTGQLVLSGGVKAGELVVTHGGQLLRPGEIVEPLIETAKAGEGGS